MRKAKSSSFGRKAPAGKKAGHLHTNSTTRPGVRPLKPTSFPAFPPGVLPHPSQRLTEVSQSSTEFEQGRSSRMSPNDRGHASPAEIEPGGVHINHRSIEGNMRSEPGAASIAFPELHTVQHHFFC